jgi:hypothetical protein
VSSAATAFWLGVSFTPVAVTAPALGNLGVLLLLCTGPAGTKVTPPVPSPAAVFAAAVAGGCAALLAVLFAWAPDAHSKAKEASSRWLCHQVAVLEHMCGCVGREAADGYV